MTSISAILLAGIWAGASAAPASVTLASQWKEKVVWSFGSGTDGQYPAAGLIEVKGTLYGTTYVGGAEDRGTVFAIDPKTSAETVLYSFGTGTDAEDPNGGLLDVRGMLYGTTVSGGSQGSGAVFTLDPKTGMEGVIHSFGSGNDGKSPYAGVITVDDTLYGTTEVGGAGQCQYGCGILFAVNRKTGAETIPYTFASDTDGHYPTAGLVRVNGLLFGTTTAGGAYGGQYLGGTVFSLDPGTGAEALVHSFGSGEDGANPYAGLIAVDGTLYGTTWDGGTYGHGIVFSLDPSTGAETVLHAFGGGPDGDSPLASLLDMKGTLYGTTFYGGSAESGAVFAVNRTTGAEKVLYSFCSQQNCTDGYWPGADLIDVDGTLFGTTTSGGAYGAGTVFALVKSR